MPGIIHPIRLLIHPRDPIYVPVTERLLAAVREEPETFDVVVGEPGVEDHVGYHDTTLSSTVWVREHGTQYMRLTLRPGRHPLFDDLLKIVTGTDKEIAS